MLLNIHCTVCAQKYATSAVKCCNTPAQTKQAQFEAQFSFSLSLSGAAMTSCFVTIWDAHWNPRLRMLIHDVLQRPAEFAVTAAFENASCTSLEAAKCLTISSPCLAVFTDHQRMQLLEAIDAADCNGDFLQFS
jgi:hypothetical protein